MAIRDLSNNSPGAVLPVKPSGLILLASKTASAVATLDITTRNAPGQSGALFSSDFDEYEIHMNNMLPATNTASLMVRFSTDGGSTYLATNYYFGSHWALNSLADGTYNDGSFGSTSFVTIDNTSSTYGGCSKMTVFAPASATTHLVNWLSNAVKGDGVIIGIRGSGLQTGTSAFNAVRFLFNSGNITSGTVRIYGVSK